MSMLAFITDPVHGVFQVVQKAGYIDAYTMYSGECDGLPIYHGHSLSEALQVIAQELKQKELETCGSLEI